MELEEATLEFRNLMSKVKKKFVPGFVSWIKKHVDTLEEDLDDNDDDDDDHLENSDVILESIRDDLREIVPFIGILPSEKITLPSVGPNADCKPESTLHIDAFLYEEDELKTLENEGKISLFYCEDCSSKKISPFNLVTHSASKSQVKYIFKYLLPDLTGKTVLDVGSRFGPLLYGAYLWTNAKIEGVEIDENLCKIQNQIITKYKFQDRIKIYQSDILNEARLLEKADVIILNNVFEFFMPLETQEIVWQFLHTHIKRKGVFLITHPSIEESLSSIKLDLKVQHWLKKVDTTTILLNASLFFYGKTIPSETDLSNFHLYQVL